MIRVQAWNEFVSPKFYGPLAIWPWLRISHQSSSNVIYLIITAWQWLMSFPYTPYILMQIKPIKAYQGKGWGTLLLRECLRHSYVLSPWESGRAIPFPPQDSVASVNLSYLSHNAVDTACPWPHQDTVVFVILRSASSSRTVSADHCWLQPIHVQHSQVFRLL